MNKRKGVRVANMRNKGKKKERTCLCRKEGKVKEEKAQSAE